MLARCIRLWETGSLVCTCSRWRPDTEKVDTLGRVPIHWVELYSMLSSAASQGGPLHPSGESNVLFPTNGMQSAEMRLVVPC